MKKLLLIALSALLLSSCRGQSTTVTDNQDKLQVYTSFYAMYDLARQIGGDMADVYNMCPPGSEPHDFEPTAQDMAALSKADVFVYNGMGIESWAKDIADTLNDKVSVCNASMDLMSSSQDVDAHVWLNPDYAGMEAAAIADKYAEASDENSEYYLQRLDEFKDKTEKLKADYKSVIDSLPNKTIVVSHDAYENLCSAFGITQYPINGKDNEGDPSPRRMADIEDFIIKNNIKYIFTEPLGTSTVVETIAKDTGCELLELDPFEGNLSDEDYFTVMYRNLEALKKALE